MKEKTFNPAPIKNRFLAFLFDIFLLYILRSAYILLSLQYWVLPKFILFKNKYEMIYKINFELNKISFEYFTRSDFYSTILIWIFFGLLISVLYNTIFLSIMSATIGQKISNIYVINNKDEKLSFIQALFRSILISFPWFLSFLLIIEKMLSDLEIIPINKFMTIIMILIFVTWYDLIFMTGKRMFIHDFLTSTRVISLEEQRSFNILDVIFPDFKTLYKFVKEDIGKKIIQIKDIIKKK